MKCITCVDLQKPVRDDIDIIAEDVAVTPGYRKWT